MPSLLPGYEYDIFISYRHNDNLDGWVTDFVSALQKELKSTLKESVSIYFDKNPHDGLLETHHVDKSLEGKLKCLVFIPIISQTYCDPKAFAWRYEFCAFNKQARADNFHRDIKLNNGNVASRILPVRIHDLDSADKAALENEVDGPLRAIEFIYKEPGVNRPLQPDEERPSANEYQTYFRNQINKVAIAIRELILAMTNPSSTLSLQPQGKPRTNNGNNSNSIAVLPFVNISNDPEQEYFCDGITEEIINTLNSTGSLRVIARTSAFAFKNKFHEIREIGSQLNVNYILEGSIRKSHERIRLTANLVDTGSGAHLWSSKFDRDTSDIFAIQEEIAQSIANQLKILSQDKFIRPHTTNIEAFNFYLMGRYIAARGEAGWGKKSLDLYRQAIQKDPRFSAVHAAIALNAWIQAAENPESYAELVKKHARLALQFDERNAEAHAAIALSKYYTEWKWGEAEQEFVKAIQLNSHSVLVQTHFATLLSNVGRGQEAFALLDRALQIDPLNTVVNQTLGWCYFSMRQYEASKLQSEETLTIEPSNFLAKIVLCFALIELHDFDSTRSVIDSLPSGNLFARACEVWMYSTGGKIEIARRITDECTKSGEEYPICIAWMKIAINDIDGAFEWLDIAVEKRDIMILSLPVFRWWDAIREDRRFHDVLDKTGLSAYIKTFPTS